MRIFTKGDYVDFEAPVHMSELQQEKFLKFMKELKNISFENIEEPQKDVKPTVRKQKKWSVDDFFIPSSQIEHLLFTLLFPKG